MQNPPERTRSVQATFHREPIRHLNLTPFPCTPAATSLREAIRLMKERRSATVLVCSASRLVGIFTERDVLMKIMGKDVDYDAPVEPFMTPRPQCLGPEDTLAAAIRVMTEGEFRHVPIVDQEGKPLWLLGARDLVDFIAEHFPQEVLNLPPEMQQTSVRPEGG
ncbi:MAG: CBS domain-containing protein [Acidobacteria bacterium]|nr:CBS domain-containing protein [Acidobacteriota bacterium]